MQITSVDSKQDLYHMKDVLPNELITELRKIPLDTAPFTKMDWQEHMPRRRLTQMPGSVLTQIHQNLNDNKSQIANAIGQHINTIDTAFWYDLEGFDFSPHIDNPGVEKVMQIYLSDCNNAGTVFYNVKDSDVEVREDAQVWHYQGPRPPLDIRQAFEFKENTGYLMINGKHQLHGVPNKIGKDDIRLSVYCWIN